MSVSIDEWAGCYPSRWKGVIVPEAMTHPAKFSSRLIQRIYEHLRDEGWIYPGATILDPFGGVAPGGLYAMLAGLHWVGVELEPKFAELGNRNIEKWRHDFASLPNLGTATLLNGDSRKLLEFVKHAQVTVSSPPYAESDPSASHVQGHSRLDPNSKNFRPFAVKSINEGYNDNREYGLTPGQLGAMRAGRFESAISSPPFMKQEQGGGIASAIRGEGKYAVTVKGGVRPNGYEGQGQSDGQLASTSDDDFWLASRVIVEQVYAALRPGGHAVWVVKNYVKDKQIVPFCDQWRQLCEAVGFATLHEHHAMLVRHNGTSYTLDGGKVEHKTEAKSFFRRLAEKNGSPHIDWETIYCMSKGDV